MNIGSIVLCALIATALTSQAIGATPQALPDGNQFLIPLPAEFSNTLVQLATKSGKLSGTAPANTDLLKQDTEFLTRSLKDLRVTEAAAKRVSDALQPYSDPSAPGSNTAYASDVPKLAIAGLVAVFDEQQRERSEQQRQKSEQRDWTMLWVRVAISAFLLIFAGIAYLRSGTNQAAKHGASIAVGAVIAYWLKS